MARRWVVIETGSNQALVFQTNKQRLNVAASRLIWRVGFEWIPDAVAAAGGAGAGVEQVVKASGLGIILAPPDLGSQIIEAVTTRATLEAPDLEVWGVVGDIDVADDLSNVGPTLGWAQRQLARWRADRPSPIARDPNLPFTRLCPFTGRPATTEVSEGTSQQRVHHSAAAGIAALWQSSMEDRDQLVGSLGGSEIVERAVVSRDDLKSGDGVRNNGWIGVLHADGNGIGDIFTNLRRVDLPGQEVIDLLNSVSEALERCAWNAVQTAIERTDAMIAEADGKPRSSWVLPILVGGDDITVLLHGRYALEFTVILAEEFERLVNAEEAVTDALAYVSIAQSDWHRGGLITSVTVPDRITLACGLVYTKPHHPFSHAVDLAEELTKSAKTVKHEGLSALDVHVLNESAVRGLDQVRAPLDVGGRKLWAGPIVLGDADHPRHLDGLRAAMRLMVHAEGNEHPVPSGVLHGLREALTTGGEADLAAVRARAKEVARERGYEDNLTTLLDEHLEFEGAEPFSRLLTAMELLDVTSGTVAGNRDD